MIRTVNKLKKKKTAANISNINISLFASLILFLMTGTLLIILSKGGTLSGITNFLPVFIFQFVSLSLYAVVRYLLVNRFFYTPLDRLAQSVSETKSGNDNIYGNDRDDKIGDLARTIQDSTHEWRRLDQLLYAVNRAAAILLSTTDGKKLESTLLECMELMGKCVNADRVCFIKNEIRDGKHYYVYHYDWSNELINERAPLPKGLAVPYSTIPDWEIRFAEGECLNGPVWRQSESFRAYFGRFDIKSLFIIPILMEDQFWGLFSFTDCLRERAFTEAEVNILRSASLMMVSAVNRGKQAAQLQISHDRTKTWLDSAPFICHLWDRDLKIFDCNEANVKLFKLSNKREFLDHFYDFSAEYQDDGQPSSEKAVELVKKAFDEGRCVSEWTARLLDGTPIPLEITLVRVPFEDDYIVATYSRDLRVHRKVMREIERRDYLSFMTNKVAEVLLQSEIDAFEKGFSHVMAMVAEAVSVNRVRLWKNHKIDGKLCCNLLFEWAESPAEPGGRGSPPVGLKLNQNNEITVNLPYDDIVPGWKETLSRGDCINNPVRDMPAEVRAQLSSRGILSVFAVPVFVRNEFWGFVSYDDCRHERLFTLDEHSIMRSVSLLMTSAWLRNEMTLNIRDTAAMQKAVFTNYPGIIWCVDHDYTITLFDGQYLDEHGRYSSFFEGRKTDEVLKEDWSSPVNETIKKTFAYGHQDRNVGINGRTFRIRTTPVYDGNGDMASVVGNFDDITERIRLQAELKTALAEAQDANRSKSTFLANMSHEMRTPLNAVIGLSELTLETGVLDEAARDNLEKICNAGATLLSTVNDILDISKIEAGRFELVPVDYDIPGLINDAIAQSIMRIGEKPINFSLNIGGDLPAYLRGDDLRVKQIMNNLLSNAFKYTKEGTVELTVSCEREGDTVWMTVRVGDTGIGIREDDMPNLFLNYYKADMESNRNIEGAGLGLPITMNVARMMGGEITVESEYGKGSVFTARFRQQFVTNAVIGAELAGTLKNFRYSDHRRRRNLRMTRIRAPYARVLVVDDVLTNLDVARGMMQLYGMRIDCVTSGQEAVDAVRSEKVRYSAIFMDHMMPGMDGIEATRIIREEIGTGYAKTVPVIALTANAISGNEEMFLQKGFQAFLSKPIEMAHLDMIIRQWIRDKNQEEKLSYNTPELPENETGQPEKAAQSFPMRLDGADLQKAFRRFDCDTESFLTILRSYAVNTPRVLDLMRELDRENLAEYAVAVHGIKGSSRSICAESIGDSAEALEEAAKKGDIGFVTANNAAFIEAAGKLITGIRDIVNKMTANKLASNKLASNKLAGENPRPVKDKPDSEALLKLITACENYDIDGADKAMGEIESFKYESDDGLTIWLRENVDMMNYSRIMENEQIRGLIADETHK